MFSHDSKTGCLYCENNIFRSCRLGQPAKRLLKNLLNTMKAIMLLLLYFMMLLPVSIPIHAQQFSNGELSIIKPSLVIVENYIRVNLSKDIIEDTMANLFDPNNPYTYLQVVNDAVFNRYHILFQTNFLGKILFLSYSNNLSELFNKKDKPMFLFARCLKEINNHISSVQIINAVVNCIADRLNYCFNN